MSEPETPPKFVYQCNVVILTLQLYELQHHFENNTHLDVYEDSRRSVKFHVNVQETIFNNSYELTTDNIGPGMGSNMFETKAYPENVFGTAPIEIIATIEDTGEIVGICSQTIERIGSTGALLIIDRSGSMGLQNKMQIAKTAAQAFIDSISRYTYSPSLNLIFTNYYGVVYYNQEASILDISPIPPFVIDFESPDEAYNPWVIDAIQRIEPQGYTSIGAGLQIARQIIEEQAISFRRVILLLSDGKENREPWISTELNPLISEIIKVYSVGFGYDYQIDSGKLQRLSDETLGRYRHVDDPDHLTKFYMEVLAEAFDYGVLMDPSFSIQAGESKNHYIDITSMDTELIFILSWRDPSHELNYIIHTPRGIIKPTSLPIGSQFIDRDLAYKIYKIQVRSDEKSITFPGGWNVEIIANKHNENYTLTILTRSQVVFQVYLPKKVFIGQDIPIYARLLNNGEYIDNAVIELLISIPTENFQDRIAREKIPLKNLSKIKTYEGAKCSVTKIVKTRKAHAIYKGGPIPRKEVRMKLNPYESKLDTTKKFMCILKDIKYPGNYNMRFFAKWKTEKGEVINRELNRSLYIETQVSDNPQINIKRLKNNKNENLLHIRVDIAPKDIMGNLLGLGLAEEMTITGPATRTKGFLDLFNGWYQIETYILPDSGPIFIRFRNHLWKVPLSFPKDQKMS
ncbi:MAG: VWA domain-containing protein [Promethearchaeota archaeon]